MGASTRGFGTTLAVLVLPFRVTQSGGRLTVDVAHSWNATS
ncbi:hypothetical protein ACIOJD_02645 [Streptomyces sp. NPDC088116]